MTRDSSLGEFSNDAEETTNDVDETTTDPAKGTYDWSPDGAACESCGETVEKRWRDDVGMVCSECKAW